MNCLLVSATTKEIAPFLDHYRNGGNKQDIDVLITGIGLAATTYALAKQCALKRPGCIIQAGIAGCFDKNISLGTVVIVRQDVIADLGVMENKQLNSIFDLGLVHFNQFPFRKGWLVNPRKELMRRPKLKTVKAVSVNHITTTRQMIAVYENKYEPVIESMEGAALHYIGLMENIPFLQIRSISNYIGERNKKEWNIKDAIANLNKELTGIINDLSSTSNQQPVSSIQHPVSIIHYPAPSNK
jgi:futalosine hydrolase